MILWGAQTGSVPTLPPGVTYEDATAGYDFTVALRSDGAAIAWGNNSFGQCNVPSLPPGAAYESVVTGVEYCIAHRTDGEWIVWGNNYNGQCNLPTLAAGQSYIKVAPGNVHTALLRNDGQIVTCGLNNFGQLNVPSPPPGTVYTDVAVGRLHSMGLLSDGTIAAWGGNYAGQCDVPPLPPGEVYAAISAGRDYSLALRSDGILVAWGDNALGQCDVPSAPLGTAVVEFEGGADFGLAMVEDPCGGPPYAHAYCAPAAPNSVSSSGAVFALAGCGNVPANNLTFTVADLPPGKPGIFFYGPFQTQVPFGNGWVCVGGQVTRVPEAQYASGAGAVTYPVDLTRQPFASGPGQILSGSTWNFQFWYRDPGGGLSTFNLSNAVQIVFAP